MHLCALNLARFPKLISMLLNTCLKECSYPAFESSWKFEIGIEKWDLTLKFHVAATDRLEYSFADYTDIKRWL